MLNENCMKLHLSNKTVVLGACALFAFTVPMRADDNSKDNSGDNNNQNQASQKADNGDNGDGGDNSGKVSPVQSSADPYGLKKAGPVMLAGSTAASAKFDSTELPAAMKFISQALPETKNNTKSAAFEIDPSKIVLATKQAVTATFIYEGAAYHNAIGFDTVAAGAKSPQSTWDELTSPTARLIFPDASSTEGGFASGKYGTRTASEPVLPGDFVNLGTFSKGTKLDFFLMANGANQAWASTFSTSEALNQDGFKQHVAAFTPHLFAVPQLNSPYLFLSFEDLWGGGDKDINDTIVAINVGTATIKSLLSTPEPAMWLTFGSFLAVAIWAKRRMANQATATVA